MSPRRIKHADCWSINLRVFKKMFVLAKHRLRDYHSLRWSRLACLMPWCRAQSRQREASSGDKDDKIKPKWWRPCPDSIILRASFAHRVSAAVGRDGCTAGVIIRACLPSSLSVLWSFPKGSELQVNPQLGLCGPHGPWVVFLFVYLPSWKVFLFL